MDFSKEKIDKLLLYFHSNTAGLAKKEVLARLDKFGQNEITKKESFNLWNKAFRQFTDLLVLLLVIAGTLAIIFQVYRDAAIMFIIVIVNAAIGFSQEYKTEQTLKQLSAMVPKKCRVLREGKELEIQSRFIVPGDIIILQAGEDVPADARLFETYSLYADESSLTGESHPQHKHLHLDHQQHITKDNMVYMGTNILEGEAKALVVNTGKNSEFGKIAQKTHDVKLDLSPLQKKLREVGKTVAIIASIILIVVVAWQMISGKNMLDAFVFALALAAAVVPEGLPATVSVALSLGARRLAKAHAVVRRLSSVESLGGVTVICSDKTGTITEGIMSVDKIWTADFKEPIKWKEFFQKNSSEIFNDFSLCQNTKETNGQIVGDINEVAFIKALIQKKSDFKKIISQYKKLAEFSFSSARKLMTVILAKKEKHDDYLVVSKGAPNKILDNCQLTALKKRKILDITDKMASRGLRVFAFAGKKINKKIVISHSLEKNLQFSCLVGLRDKVREEVPEAINTCHQAGIRIIMLTGDYGLTARAVAKEINLAGSADLQIICADDLKKITNLELREKLLHPTVIYQILPGDKLKIVETLQNMGEVVAVTGDGVNDAPALKKADIGVAMGKIGTDVAREASDMVLLNDNFASIVCAIKEGRLAWENLKKFLFYVFASNAGELLTLLVGIVSLLPLPILAVQILAVDLGTDVLPSIALAADPAEKDLMKRKPHSPKEILLNPATLYRLLYVGIIMGGGAVLCFWLATKLGLNYAQATTASYAALVICQIINAFSIRYHQESVFYNFLANKYLLLAEVASLMLLVAIVYWAPLEYMLSTGPLPWTVWLVISSVAIFFYIIEEVKKNRLRKFGH